ncbi:ABC transporter ATP-binding protein [Mesorhizobium sp. 1B3]|uniref:ABC transporter ATP-binding protein n=1 Tax=Mesorhizobium sp. 1B3 TaxID=3243599 RepID=UPI003D99EDB0
MNDPLLSVRDLKVFFASAQGETPVVHGVSFDVEAGKTLALVGGSGSGKSVIAMSLMQLLDRRTSRVTGTAQFGGRDLISLAEREIQSVRGNQIGMIFQEPMTSLNPVLTVGYQLAETLKRHRGLSHRAALAEARELLEKVRIPAAQRRLAEYPHRLSGGMRQRVMIAMAMACRPKLLIADEPTTALDVTVQAQILDLMRLLQQEEGTSILFITHDMGVVAEVADRTLVVHNGMVVEEGPTADLFQGASQPYTLSLLGAVPRLGSMRGTQMPRAFPEIDALTGKAQEAGREVDTIRHGEPPVLSVRGLTTRFDLHSGLLKRVTARVHAVENVDLTLRRGETLGLVGESGCGKSTLGRSLMQLEKASAGEIVIHGMKLGQTPRRNVIPHIQMVFQDPFASLNPRIRVGESIAAPLVNNGVLGHSAALTRAGELLGLVGLEPDMVERYPHEFSGGQRQRICIARALALEPEIIVADEAVSALDVTVKTQVLNLMLGLQEHLGLSYLFISHDMAVVERVAHRVAVMYLGEVVEIGPRAAIFENPQHPYTKRLIAAVPVPDPARRHAPRPPSNQDIRSPIFPIDHVPPARRYREASAAHLVQEWNEADWT